DRRDADRAGEPLGTEKPAWNLTGHEGGEALGDIADRVERELHPVRDGGLHRNQSRNADAHIAGVARIADRSEDVGEWLAVGVEACEHDGLAGRGLLLLLDVPGAGDRLAVDGTDAVPDMDAGHRSRSARDDAYYLARVVVELAQAVAGDEQDGDEEGGGRSG